MDRDWKSLFEGLAVVLAVGLSMLLWAGGVPYWLAFTPTVVVFVLWCYRTVFVHDTPEVVTVITYDPMAPGNSLVRRQLVVGEEVSKEDVARWRDPKSGNLHALVVYRAGQPEIRLATKEGWDQAISDINRRIGGGDGID